MAHVTRSELTTLDDAALDSAAPPPAVLPNPQGALERIPLPWDGAWRHSATRDLRQPQFCAALRGMLEG